MSKRMRKLLRLTIDLFCKNFEASNLEAAKERTMKQIDQLLGDMSVNVKDWAPPPSEFFREEVFEELASTWVETSRD